MAERAVCSDALDDHGQALADTDTQADDRVALAAALQFARGGQRQTGTGGAQRVTHGDGAAVRVHARVVEGDAQAVAIFADAYGRDPEFYEFVRTLEAYRNTLRENTTIILSPHSDFFRLLQRIE